MFLKGAAKDRTDLDFFPSDFFERPCGVLGDAGSQEAFGSGSVSKDFFLLRDTQDNGFCVRECDFIDVDFLEVLGCGDSISIERTRRSGFLGDDSVNRSGIGLGNPRLGLDFFEPDLERRRGGCLGDSEGKLGILSGDARADLEFFFEPDLERRGGCLGDAGSRMGTGSSVVDFEDLGFLPPDLVRRSCGLGDAERLEGTVSGDARADGDFRPPDLRLRSSGGAGSGDFFPSEREEADFFPSDLEEMDFFPTDLEDGDFFPNDLRRCSFGSGDA